MKILQIHPTLKCNQSCTWCTYEKKNVELPFWKIKKQILHARYLGCKILKISGGGEPTLYPDLELVLKCASALGFIVYLQTNGSHLTSRLRALCHDIRISFGDGRPFFPPLIDPDGFSYVVSRNPDYDNLNTLLYYALEKFMYVRITQDDMDIENVPSIEEIQENIILKEFIINGGTEWRRLSHLNHLIHFWDAKNFHQGRNPCPSWDSPLYGADDVWYPCCKTHVAKGLVKGYNESMWLGMELPEQPYDGRECTRCYYGD